MRLKNLDWDYKRILQKIIVDLSIEYIDSSIITTTGEEWVLLRELDIPNSFIVILQTLVWLRSHVDIEPDDLLVIRS